ncbi:MAG: M23 family metallopeptidase [Oscillospiraceae bacterium]|nr:M23 family metallopeptidase [Oscillospiraceae bacterium]
MKEKNGLWKHVDAFFNGKGFYIVLFACAAVIAVSAWSLFGRSGGEAAAEREIRSADVGIEEGLSAFAGGGQEIKTETARPSPAPVTVEVGAAAAPAALPAEEETEETAAVPEPVREPAAPTSFVWPAAGEISMDYSVDYPVYNRTMRDWRTHDGVDIEAETGAPVLAAAAGRVREVRNDEAYGTTVTIEHGAGLGSVYAGLAETPAVKPGDEISAGTVIGSVGNTAACETAEPSHLHFAMTKDGESVDPAEYLPER